MPLAQPPTRRKFWVRSAAVAAAGAGALTALTVFATPSQAVTVPPPGQSVLLVRDFVDGNTIIGQIYISPCPGAPLPGNWGVDNGPSKIVGLPCGDTNDPTQPGSPFPTDGNPTLPGTGF